jgi:hypothetical protein
MNKRLIFSVVLLSLSFLTAFSQTGDIKGKVVDESGTPIGGVSVVVKGQAVGVTTDATGAFSITNAAGKTLQLDMNPDKSLLPTIFKFPSKPIPSLFLRLSSQVLADRLSSVN